LEEFFYKISKSGFALQMARKN